MDLPDNLLDSGWCWAAWAVWLPLIVRSVRRAPWRRLTDPARFNVWLGMIVFLTLVWSLKAGVKPGLSFHLLGASVFALCFGPALAFIGLNFVLLGITLNGAAGIFAFAANALLLAGLPVWSSNMVYRLSARRLPRNLFVYIFINGFFGAAAALLAVGFAASLLLASADVYELTYLFSEYFPYFILLAFSEAWLSGMMITLFVVYRPEWVATFDDSNYLAHK